MTIRVSAPSIFLFTDFGSGDLYVGQMRAVLHAGAPASAVVDLLNDAPAFHVEASAHLLAALAQRLPPGAITIAVVDPGVGSERGMLVMHADTRWFVGPDNGLLSVLSARARQVRLHSLEVGAEGASVSFHGRDIFAPAAARIARGSIDLCELAPRATMDVEFGDGDLREVIYVDHYGNVLTGIRAETCEKGRTLELRGHRISYARVFSAVPKNALFWYENSLGLVEVAANQASAAALTQAAIGDAVCLR